MKLEASAKHCNSIGRYETSVIKNELTGTLFILIKMIVFELWFRTLMSRTSEELKNFAKLNCTSDTQGSVAGPGLLYVNGYRQRRAELYRVSAMHSLVDRRINVRKLTRNLPTV
ncbi:hypothetical protein ElyMa_006655600 [Elysia marginata]|uniref:Uncharacterized protein n=1 Tax=Elysia marginata TaxID=1093978 RepID=A0AAV4IJT9_9GAST|nr:hypothetical protein ElyMa_006655600 [Elysia marginata]